MERMKLIIRYLTAFLLLACSACESWLNVTPSDRLSEDMLFEDREGFIKALNGVYIELNATQLYGKDMTAGALDVMGQYYNVSASSHVFGQYGKLIYTENNEKTLFDNMWQKCYLVIACCNTIIEKCDENTANLSPVWLGVIKGEALALRAMLHFDMLRLFGPLTSELEKESIPYQTSSLQEVTPILSGEKVIELILDDLKTALNLLKESDPYFVSEVFSDTDINYRQFRMNYFATKALMARVYLWAGDKNNACMTAKEVIAEGQQEGAELFPFVTNEAATSSNPDRIFFTEVLFGIYNSTREKLHEELFAPTLESTNILTLASTARRDELYDENDYRYQVWSTYNNNGTSVLYQRKYEKQDNVTDSRQYMIALIRMSEMYLIVAECSENLDEATSYLNIYRNARNCFSIYPTRENMISTLADEYKKEMLGEGQLFFFYKRQEMINIPDGNLASGTKNVELSKYVIPLPESETDQRINSMDISK